MDENRFSGILSRQKTLVMVKELFRKSIHLCSAIIPFLLHWNYWVTIALLCAAICIYSVCELLRLNGINVPLVSTVTNIAARKRDENRFVLGPVTLCIGILLCAFIYKGKSVDIGIYALAFGDGLASLVGKLFGKKRIPFVRGKTVEGCLTCFLAIFISCFLVCKNCTIALIVAFAGMLVEMLPLKDWDNVLIPLTAGGLSQLLFLVF